MSGGFHNPGSKYLRCFKRRFSLVEFPRIQSGGGETEFGKTQTNPGSVWQWASDKGVISGARGRVERVGDTFTPLSLAPGNNAALSEAVTSEWYRLN